MNNNLPFSWHICYSQPTTYFSLSNQPKSFFSNCEPNKTNSFKKKTWVPPHPQPPFSSAPAAAGHAEEALAQATIKGTTAPQADVLPGAVACNELIKTSAQIRRNWVTQWLSVKFLSVLFTVYDFYDCWVFFTKKTSSSKTVGHLYGNENSYLNLNHHFGGTWHH